MLLRYIFHRVQFHIELVVTICTWCTTVMYYESTSEL